MFTQRKLRQIPEARLGKAVVSTARLLFLSGKLVRLPPGLGAAVTSSKDTAALVEQFSSFTLADPICLNLHLERTKTKSRISYLKSVSIGSL